MNKDELGDSVDGILYTINGKSRVGTKCYTTGKINKSKDDEELYFFITAHEIEK